MKRHIYIISLLFVFTKVNAQQYPLFSNYITNCFGYNPGVAAQSECLDMKATHRAQWQGVAGSPTTSLVSIHKKLPKLPLGVGGYFFNDQAGTLKRTGGSLALCYGMKLDSSTYLGIGVTAGFYRFGLSDVKITDQVDNTISNGQLGKNIPDFNAGVYFRKKNLWLGFSVPQVLEKKINFTGTGAGQTVTSSQLKRHYYAMAGYDIPLGKIRIEPSVFVKYVENAPLSWDAGARFVYDNSFWIGGIYRHKDAAALMAGIDTKKGISFFYSYDLTTSGLSTVSNGSHEFGLGYKICKCTDKDGDGICDKEDKCPDEPGTKENMGCPPGKKPGDCPDKDGDGICDKDDECPDEKGTKEFKGCPTDPNGDTDKDGVLNKDDLCPNQPGIKENKGCPMGDRDNDGIRDDIDKCPDIAGTLANGGCPLGDRDQDGILDSVDPCPDDAGPLSNQGCPPGKLPSSFQSGVGSYDPNGDDDGDGIPNGIDKCPQTAGTKGRGGCPTIDPEAKRLIDIAIRHVYFDFDKAELRSESFPYLNNLANWMVNHPEYNIKIDGHTDNRGTVEYNNELSKNRIFSVLHYMEDRGVSATRIAHAWHGESMPIATNKTEQGMQQNRRVEMQWDFN
jgi:type IX secretion system PorP/SprF family membrane protein